MGGRLRFFVLLSLTHARRHRSRTILTAVGVALGVASVTAVLVLSRSITAAFEGSIVRGAGAAQLQVSNGTTGVDRDLVYELASTPGITATGATVEHHVAAAALGRRITVLGVELGRDEAYREVQVGPHVADLPDALRFIANTDSIALSTTILDERGWKLGDSIELAGPKGPHRFVIRGALRSQGILQAFGGDVALMDLDAAQLRFGDSTKVHWIDLVVAADASIDGVQADVAGRLAGRAAVEPPAMRGRRIERIMSLIRGLLTATSVVAMLVGSFLIHHALATSYRQRRGDLLRLRQLGVSRRGVLAYLLMEAGCLGVVASTVGLALGAAFWRLATREFSHAMSEFTLPLPPVTFAMAPSELASTVLLGTLVVVLGALSPVIGMLRMRPVQSHDAPATGTTSTVALAAASVTLTILAIGLAPLTHRFGFLGQTLLISLITVCLFLSATLAVPLVLVASQRMMMGGSRSERALLRRWMWHQVWRHRLHTSTTTGALAAGVAYAIAISVLLGSYRAAITEWIDQMFAGDVVVLAGTSLSLLGGHTFDHGVIETLTKIEGVARVDPWRLVEGRFRDQPIIVQALPDLALARIAPDLDLATDPVIVSDSFAEYFHVDTGDTITIPAPVPLTARIAAVVPDYVLHLGAVKLTWHAYREHFHDTGVSFAFANAASGVAPAAVKQRIEAALSHRYDISTLLTIEIRALIDQLTRQSLAMTNWMQALAALVAIAAMVNATTASIIDREAELRTWRALGLLRGRLVRLLIVEAVFVGAVGSALGLATGTLLGHMLTTTIAAAVAGYRLPVYWPLGTMAGVPTFSILGAAAAAALVARRWTRHRALIASAVSR